MLLEINDFVLCLGVGKATAELHAHLFCLNDPICLMTRRWQHGEEFITGKWYRKNKSKKYELIADIVPTMAVQKMDLIGDSKKTILELILPVFFPPDLASLKQYGQIPILHNRNSLSIPICPLFGPDNIEYLPAVGWDQEQISMYSDQLYALKINLSYIIGSSPQWTHLNTSQLKPWDYEEYQIVKQLCLESRSEGLLLDGICPVHHGKNSPTICFMLNKQAELAIAICPPIRKKGSEFREFWPIRLGIYEFPVIIALDCPQSDHHNFKNDIIVRKLVSTNLQFEINYTGKGSEMENLSNFPWLGSITDQFHYLLDARVKDETFSAIQATMIYSLEKRSVAWVVVGIKDQGTFEMSDNLLNGENEEKCNLLQDTAQLEKPDGNKNKYFQQPAEWPKRWAIIIVENAITQNICREFIKRFTQMARQKGLTNCLTDKPNQVLWEEWKESTLVFFEDKFKYFDKMDCRFVMLFAEEKDEIHNLTKLMEERYKVLIQNIGADIALKGAGCIRAVPSRIGIENVLLETNQKLGGINYPLEENRNCADHPSNSYVDITASHSSVTPKKSAIAVFMTIRYGGDGNAVFLFWDPKSEKFYRKGYAEFHKNVSFNVEFGKWFELEYLDFPHSEYRITVFDLKEIQPRAVTRVRDNLCAQFFTNRERYINVWHTTFPCPEKNNYAQDMGWWPWLCRKCFPSLRELSPPISKSKEDQKMKEEMTGSLENLTKRMRGSFAKEAESVPTFKEKILNEDKLLSTARKDLVKKEPNIPIIQKQPANPPSASSTSTAGLTTSVLGVLFTVRETNGDAVFLIYNNTKNEFTHRIYGNPPEKIIGCPLIGRWYWLKYRSDAALLDGHKIYVIDVENFIGEPPVETRLKYGLAQFNTKQRFIKTWHGIEQHKPSSELESYNRDWWPNICFYCYPNADKNEAPIANKKEEVNNAVANSAAKWATGANTIPVAAVKSTSWTTRNAGDKFTDTSHSDSEEDEIRSIRSKGTNSNYSTKDGSGTSQMSSNTTINRRSFTPISISAANVRPPPISAVGNIFGPVKSQSSSAIKGTSNLNGNQPNWLAPAATAARSAQNETNKSSDNSQPSKLIGGFGMGRPRRQQQLLANSTLSYSRSNSPSISQMGQK